jgi:hypothetical protein
MSPLSQRLYDAAKAVIDQVKTIRRFTWHNLGVITDLVSTLVQSVETGQEFAGLSGAQKKATVIEVIDAVIDAIDLKILPIWIPQAWVKTILKQLIPILIDWIVGLFNKGVKFAHK